MVSNTPRRKKFNAVQRRSAAIRWLPTYTGKNLVDGYSRWFGVDRICALGELKQIGVVFDDVFLERLRQSEADRIAQKHRARDRRVEKLRAASEFDEFWLWNEDFWIESAAY